ncbi:hypothetical protein FRC11_007052 [Ceratobasidium sp. 423]|nr:hypothetical protein FRC11_007052 [Ceratobasidium sp. 423]
MGKTSTSPSILDLQTSRTRSLKPPPTPTPRESTPIDPAQLESTPVPLVEGQVLVENGSGEPHVGDVPPTNNEPNGVVESTQPAKEEVVEPQNSTAPSVVQENVVSS